MKNIVLTIKTFILLFTYSAYADTQCGNGWEAYGDKKCYKILPDTMVSYIDAQVNCLSQDKNATLPIIHTQNEQTFLTDLLFNKHKLVDHVWIGAKVDRHVVTWDDGTQGQYTNWAPGSPKNISNECIEIVPEDPITGKWVDEPCAKKNVLVCQKMQPWSLGHIQQLLIDQQNELDKYKKLTDNLQKTVADIQTSTFPIGFIYVQLPGQLEPHKLYPKLAWENVTPKYAGLFFRAEGGGSNMFGNGTQGESSPRLVHVHRWDDYIEDKEMDVIPGQDSRHMLTGIDNGKPISLSFLVSKDEVRPQNQAIRVWKRIK